MKAVMRLLQSCSTTMVVFVLSAFITAPAHSQVWPATCAGCHGTPADVKATHPALQAVFGLNDSWMSSAVAFDARRSALSMPSLGTVDPADVYAYLLLLRDGTASATTPVFAATNVGSSSVASFTLTVRNYRKTVLNYSVGPRTNESLGDFAIVSVSPMTNGCVTNAVPAATSASGTACDIEVTVRFSPTAPNDRTANLRVNLSASDPQVNNPERLTIPLIGGGVPVPKINLNTSAVNFGSQALEGLYGRKQVRISNVGTANLTISRSTIIVGSGYSVTGCLSATLLPGEGCDLSIGFAPNAVGSQSGTLVVESNDAASPHFLPLTGIGIPSAVPVVRWVTGPTRVTFGSVAVGSVSGELFADLVNDGPGGVRLSVVNVTGVDGPSFLVGESTTCVADRLLEEGQTCRVAWRFRPVSSGTKSAPVQVASVGSLPPRSEVVMAPALFVFGTAVPGPVSGLTLSSGSLDLGSVDVNATSSPSELILMSSGVGRLNVTAIEMIGPFDLGRTTCPEAPFVLMPSNQCSVMVSFAPDQVGAASGVLRVRSDASPALAEVMLSGTGTPAAADSGGGCSLSRGDRVADPTLGALLAAASCVLWRRRRTLRPIQSVNVRGDMQ